MNPTKPRSRFFHYTNLKKKVKPLIAATLLVLSFAVCTDAADWPHWRGPNGDGISMEADWNPRALEEGPIIVWRTNVGFGYSNVAIKDECLYTIGRDITDCVVVCLNAATGRKIWQYSFQSTENPQCTPTVDGEFVYVLSKEGILLCLKTKDGKVKWRKNIVEEYHARVPFYGFAGSPVVAGNLLILTVNTAGMALDKNTGEMVWGSGEPPKLKYHFSYTSTGVEYATPVIYEQGGTRYAVVSSYKGLHSVEVKTGKLNWLFDWEEIYRDAGVQVADPIVFDDRLFNVQYYSGYLGGFLLDIGEKAPKIVWKNSDMFSQTSSPVMIDGHLYFCQGGIEKGLGSLQCFDIATGKMNWEENLERKPISLTAAGGMLIILDNKGNIFIAKADPSNYKEISRGTIPDQKSFQKWTTPPVLCGGKLYCRSDDGDLVCIDVR